MEDIPISWQLAALAVLLEEQGVADKPAALIGVAEKGYLSVVLKMSATPGHSSMPPKKGTSAIAMMSAALKRLDDEQLPGGGAWRGSRGTNTTPFLSE